MNGPSWRQKACGMQWLGRQETSFARMIGMAAGARSGRIAEWTTEHVDHGPLGGDRKLRKELRHERQASTNQYYQLLSGLAGDHLRKMHSLPPDGCWWCGRDERQSRYDLFVKRET